MSIITGTGHRPDKLGGYSNTVYHRLVTLAKQYLTHYQPERVISGMALGWDQSLAEAAVELKIPFYAYIPFDGQEAVWKPDQKAKYWRLLGDAAVRKIVSEGGYTPEKMEIRNRAMVNDANLILALWNGSRGGTSNCVKYAQTKSVNIVNLWAAWEELNKSANPSE